MVLKAAPHDDGRVLRLGTGGSGLVASHEEHKPFYNSDNIGEYASWLADAAVGDFGTSASLQRGRPASTIIWPAATQTFKLVFVGVVLSVAIALLAAVWRTYRPSSIPARGVSWGLGLFSAIPVFLYVYLTVSLGNRLIAWGISGGHWSTPGWFPLPMKPDLAPWLFAALILAVGDGGLMDLFWRFMGELSLAGRGEHVTGARVMGLSLPLEIARGFLPGALSHISRRISFYVGSTVVLEATLGWQGLGYLAWRAAAERDMPVLLGSALVMAASLRCVLMGCDFVGYVSDPRRRRAR